MQADGRDDAPAPSEGAGETGAIKPQTEILDDGAAAHDLVTQFRLSVTEGPNVGTTFVSTGERVVIGTSPSNQLPLTDPSVSRFHCEIMLVEGRAMIRDLESRNRTLVGGVTVFTGQLKSGDVLTLGRSKIRFDLGREQIKVPLSRRDRFHLLVGRSRTMRAVFALLERAARSDATVLLQGETGTGKDAAAESIHLAGARSEGPFVVVNCSAIPAGLLESELFGHERGAFTGADRAREGAFEAASGGTLFLDEIGDLEPDLQPKLLRVLERREIQRVGSNQRTPVDVRLIAATNRDLRAEVNARRFRADLYYRLAVLEMTLPPLRERLGDLRLLVPELLEKMDAAHHPAAASLHAAGFLARLGDHVWPGNVRELRNYLERCLALDEPVPLPSVTAASETPGSIDLTQTLRVARERCVRTFERQYLEALLGLHGNNVTAAARAAGVDRIHFHRLLSRAGLR